MNDADYEVIIVGGGPTGLSAALVLGRARRSVLVCDAGEPRNAAARAVHGFLTRDGIAPGEFRRLGREEVRRYGVEIRDVRVVAACRLEPGSDVDGATEGSRGASDEPEEGEPPRGFRVTLEGGESLTGRKLLLATGIRDVLPDVPGLADFYGRGVHHCPYCDGWELRDQPLAALGDGEAAVRLALSLRSWSDDVTALTDGDVPDEAALRLAERNGVDVRTEAVERAEGEEGELRRVVLAGGDVLEVRGLFFKGAREAASHLPRVLGCRERGDGEFRAYGAQRTGVPGLFIAGDADGHVQFVIHAAAEGATAAMAIHEELAKENSGRAAGV